MTAYMDHKDLANEIIDEQRARQISDGVHRVLDQIAQAESASGREPGSVRLLAATKTRDVGEIMAAIDAGIRLIGENRPQEVTAKAAGLRRLCAQRGFTIGVGGTGDDHSDGAVGDPGQSGNTGNASATQHVTAAAGSTTAPAATVPVATAAASAAAAAATTAAGAAAAGPATHIPFHLIGQLQSNKIGKVLPVVDTIESVDSIELAERISRRAVMHGITVGVLLEVNESGEASKSGCEPSHAIDLARRIGAMGGLELQGLMTIGAHVDDERTIRAGFAHLRRTRDQILALDEPGLAHCTQLSMGMTHDLTFAIEEGSTLVRVGTAIFGERAFI